MIFVFRVKIQDFNVFLGSQLEFLDFHDFHDSPIEF